MSQNSNRMISQRLNRLYQEMESNGWDAVLITGRGNLRFFTDFRLNRVASAMLAIPEPGEVVFFVAKLDLERARRDLPFFPIRPYLEDMPSYLDGLRGVFNPNKIKKLAIESTLTYYQEQFLRDLLPNVVFLTIDQQLLALRSVKEREEIERLKKAAQIADQAMRYVLKQASPGHTELELVGQAKLVIAKEGGEDEPFEPFLMSGENACLPQRVATEKKIQEGELIVFDMGAIYKGYCSDLTRTFSLGGLSAEQKKVFQIALTAQQKAIEAIRLGMEARSIDRIARSYIEEIGFGEFFPHLTGHGIGLEDHEEPIIDKSNTLRLEENMVLTIEPGLYVPGVGAARIEDMILVTKDGAELLTSVPRNLIF